MKALNITLLLAVLMVTIGCKIGRVEGPGETKLFDSAAVAESGEFDWPNFRGPDRNGISKESGWFPKEAKLAEHWRVPVGLGFSSVTVVGGRVYTAGWAEEQDTIVCLSTTDGKVLWQYSYPATKGALYYPGGSSATPTIVEGRAYHFSRAGQVFCLDAKTGDEIWKRDIVKEFGATMPTWGYASSPVVFGDRVYLNAGDAGMALSKSDGRKVWLNGEKDTGYATPVPFTVDGKQRFAILSEKEIVAVESTDGKVLWSQRFASGWGQNSTDPVIDANSVFVSGYNVKGKRFNLSDGEPVEGFKSETKNHVQAGVLIGDHHYSFSGKVENNRSVLQCMDWKTGETIWEHQGHGAGTMIASDGKLIVLGEHGSLIIAEANPKAHKVLLEKKILEGPVWTAPTLANGRVYGRDSKGTLVSVSFVK
ncbi:MAG: PQQ-binding-like beta-propeller repeat protein [Limisphaerales bacterium]